MIYRAYCPDCPDNKACIHAGAYRRLPKEDGGLSLCKRLKDNTDPKRPIRCTSCGRLCYENKSPEIVFRNAEICICENCSIDYEEVDGKIRLRELV
jgi:hypothetical protein